MQTQCLAQKNLRNWNWEMVQRESTTLQVLGFSSLHRYREPLELLSSHLFLVLSCVLSKQHSGQVFELSHCVMPYFQLNSQRLCQNFSCMAQWYWRCQNWYRFMQSFWKVVYSSGCVPPFRKWPCLVQLRVCCWQRRLLHCSCPKQPFLGCQKPGQAWPASSHLHNEDFELYMYLSLPDPTWNRQKWAPISKKIQVCHTKSSFFENSALCSERKRERRRKCKPHCPTRYIRCERMLDWLLPRW